MDRLRPGTRDRLVPGWLDDPEFRFDAVSFALHYGETLARTGRPEARTAATNLYRLAFASARDLAQCKRAAVRLKEAGVTVSVAEHLGFLTEWYVIGPFDAAGQEIFTREFTVHTVSQPYNGVLFNPTNMGGSFSGAYQWKAWRGAAPQPSPPQPGPPPPATTQAPSPPPPQQAPPPAPAPPAPRQVKAVRDVPSGFIQNQQHAAQQCPNNCQRNGGGQWNGQWKMVRAGRHNVHVCSCNYY